MTLALPNCMYTSKQVTISKIEDEQETKVLVCTVRTWMCELHRYTAMLTISIILFVWFHIYCILLFLVWKIYAHCKYKCVSLKLLFIAHVSILQCLNIFSMTILRLCITGVCQLGWNLNLVMHFECIEMQ